MTVCATAVWTHWSQMSNLPRPTMALIAIALATAAAACDGSTDEVETAPDVTTTGSDVTTTGPIVESSKATVGVTATTPAPVYDFSEIGPIVQQFVDDRGLEGAGLVVVERDDGIVHEEYWGEFGPARVSLVASASKMIAAGVLMRLDDQGLLDVDAPIADAVDWGSANPAITPAQLVSNSSGLVGLGPNPLYRPYRCQFLPQGRLAECGERIFTTTDDDDDVIAPDTTFRYGGGQWQVAGAVAEAVSGRSWEQLLEETYVEPCGVDSLGFNNQWTQFGSIVFTYPVGFDADPSTLVATDNPNIEGGAYVTAPDYARLLLMHLREGRCGGVAVLSREAIAEMHADRIGDVYGGSAGRSGYGMGWWIDRTSGRLSDPGAYGAYPWLDIDDGHGAYLVVEADTRTGTDLAELLFEPVADAITLGRD
jgi:CubicO group peptidase (beta-lactamase class C family)